MHPFQLERLLTEIIIRCFILFLILIHLFFNIFSHLSSSGFLLAEMKYYDQNTNWKRNYLFNLHFHIAVHY